MVYGRPLLLPVETFCLFDVLINQWRLIREKLVNILFWYLIFKGNKLLEIESDSQLS